jgi:sortase A
MKKAFSIPPQDSLPVWIGSLIMILGVALAAIAVSRSLSDWQMFHSPFNQVDGPAETTDGFLPMLYSPSAGPLSSLPPPQCTGACNPPDRNKVIENVVPLPECRGSCSGTWENVEVPRYSLDPPGQRITDPEPIGGQPNGDTPLIPDRISIPSLRLDATVLPVPPKVIEYEGQTYQQWTAPDSYAAGWHNSSASLGLPGNTVINGHHNIWGDLFRYIDTLKAGDLIHLYADDHEFTYVVGSTMILPEKFESLDTRLENARWILPSDDERITLITCWPFDSNTHRVVVVAVPLENNDS